MSVADSLRAHALGVRLDNTMPGTPAQRSTEAAALKSGFVVNEKIPKEKYAERVFVLSMQVESEQDRARYYGSKCQQMGKQLQLTRSVAVLACCAAAFLAVCGVTHWLNHHNWFAGR